MYKNKRQEMDDWLYRQQAISINKKKKSSIYLP